MACPINLLLPAHKRPDGKKNLYKAYKVRILASIHSFLTCLGPWGTLAEGCNDPNLCNAGVGLEQGLKGKCQSQTFIPVFLTHVG